MIIIIVLQFYFFDLILFCYMTVVVSVFSTYEFFLTFIFTRA